MTAPLSGQFHSESSKVGGMFGGPRGHKGKYDQANMSLLSGTTYGGQGLGMFWYNYPAYIGGASNFYPGAGMPGSNVEAVQATQTEAISGMGDGITNSY